MAKGGQKTKPSKALLSSTAPDQLEPEPSWFRELELERELSEIDRDLAGGLFGPQ